MEWPLIYNKEEGDHLILAKSKVEGKLHVGKSFTYGYVRNIEYEDNDSSNLSFDVDSQVGARGVKIDECNFIIESCHPKTLNLIFALCLYVKGELVVMLVITPPRSAKKSKPEHKKYKRRQQPEEDEPRRSSSL